jgi:hypothetical protein
LIAATSAASSPLKPSGKTFDPRVLADVLGRDALNGSPPHEPGADPSSRMSLLRLESVRSKRGASRLDT